MLKKHHVPQEFDLLSIDIDGNDYWIWQQILTEFKPQVVIIEYNQLIKDDSVQPYVSDYVCNNAKSGASLTALYELGRKLGYSLVYKDFFDDNLIFIRDNIIKSNNLHFKNINNIDAWKKYSNNRMMKTLKKKSFLKKTMKLINQVFKG